LFPMSMRGLWENISGIDSILSKGLRQCFHMIDIDTEHQCGFACCYEVINTIKYSKKQWDIVQARSIQAFTTSSFTALVFTTWARLVATKSPFWLLMATSSRLSVARTLVKRTSHNLCNNELQVRGKRRFCDRIVPLFFDHR
jgi:hypothetical protein